MAISSIELIPLNVALGLSTLSNIFQMLPASINTAPLISPAMGNLYSKFNAILKLASLKSLTASVLPGPKEYGNHALLSLGPPAK